jgi:hypothetical protein
MLNWCAGRDVSAPANVIEVQIQSCCQATGAKLAASKTALGLHSVSNFPNKLPTDN